MTAAGSSRADRSDWIRAPVVAGSWYPGEAEELEREVDGYLAAARPLDGRPLGLVVPHAGYAFSGPVAAHGFRQLCDQDYEVAVIIAADHAPPISRPISVWARGGFQTPLGLVPVHQQVAQSLVEADPLIRDDPEAHLGEHPIEIELPFLQRSCPQCKIVPVLMGEVESGSIAALAEALIEALRDLKAVIIASSDLSHYPGYEDALQVDWATLAAIETGDPASVQQSVQRWMGMGIPGLATCACGEAPIRVVQLATRGLGADTISTLHYANSGDSPYGGKDRVVGYGAVMFWRYEPPSLSDQQKMQLLGLARAAIAENLGLEPPVSEPQDPAFDRLSAAFVTVRVGGELRGCIGTMRQDTPLREVVREKAVAAAAQDPRFLPLTRPELETARIEISIVSPLRRIADLDPIRIGEHGLAIYHQRHHGVLLPKVPIEQGWGKEEFARGLCRKAGLPESSWQAGAALYSFTSLDFGDPSS